MQKKHIAIGAFLAVVSMVGFGFAQDGGSLGNYPLQPKSTDAPKPFIGPQSIDPSIRPLPPIRRDDHKSNGESTDDNTIPKPRDLPKPYWTGSVGTGRVGGDIKPPRGTGTVCDNTGKVEKLAAEYARKQAQITQRGVTMNAQIQKLLAAGKITPEQATKYTARIQEQLQKKNAELTKRYTEQTARLSTNTCKGGDRGGERKSDDKPELEVHKSSGHQDGTENHAPSSDQTRLNEITMRANKIQNALNRATQDGSLSPEKIAEYQNYLINELQKRKDAITK